MHKAWCGILFLLTTVSCRHTTVTGAGGRVRLARVLSEVLDPVGVSNLGSLVSKASKSERVDMCDTWRLSGERSRLPDLAAMTASEACASARLALCGLTPYLVRQAMIAGSLDGANAELKPAPVRPRNRMETCAELLLCSLLWSPSKSVQQGALTCVRRNAV